MSVCLSLCLSVANRACVRHVYMETVKPINVKNKILDNVWTTKVDYRMQYYDVITNPKWRTVDLGICQWKKMIRLRWNLVRGIRFYMTRIQILKFKMEEGRQIEKKTSVLAITRQRIVRFFAKFCTKMQKSHSRPNTDEKWKMWQILNVKNSSWRSTSWKLSYRHISVKISSDLDEILCCWSRF